MPAPVLVALDGSNESLKAFNAALGLAQKLKLPLVLASVVGQPAFGSAPDVLRAEREVALGAYEKLHAALVQKAKAKRVRVQSRILFGEPGTQLVALAKKTKPVIVALGRHGKTREAAKHFIVGSVFAYVLQNASAPVLVV